MMCCLWRNKEWMNNKERIAVQTELLVSSAMLAEADKGMARLGHKGDI